MGGMRYLYPVRLDADEIGRLVVHFPDLPEALTDGADAEEALTEASDCLSEALAGRIHRQEDIPIPSPLRRGMYAVEPEPTIALKAALYEALGSKCMTISDFAKKTRHRRPAGAAADRPEGPHPAVQARSRAVGAGLYDRHRGPGAASCLR